ncbi:MAG TPA: DsbA family protein [Solirubrobacteraceae bacterium]|nr:DsbA family protein [Solirubrobacteraceae bacterium]
MGEVIRLAERRKARRTRRGQGVARVRAEFFFDLACPFTYLAAERVERAFDDVLWTPASKTALRAGSLVSEQEAEVAVRAAAEARAAALRLPLEWPETFPADVPAAMRVAAHAAENGRGAAFVLAAGRLAFCGGFDLDDPEILFEAAAAAGLVLEDCLRAAGHRGRDGAIEAAGRRLLAAGADRLPALRVGRSLFWGEEKVAEAAAVARHHAATTTARGV